MNRLFQIFSIILLASAALCSCSTFSDTYIENGTIIITGTVSEIDTKQPVEGVKMIFTAYPSDGTSVYPAAALNAYTDSKGTFNIKTEGVNSAVTCRIISEHPGYSQVTKEIIVNWSGTSYDASTGIFYVNDCDFHLEKK
jgi:hypothetical protein